MKRVLVTGAGGFIGSHLVDDQLARGNVVRALDLSLDRLAHQSADSRCELVKGDVRDPAVIDKAVNDVHTVFHLASAHLEVSKPDQYFREVNVDAVRSLLEASLRQGVQRFVHCSSVGVYGHLQTLPATEQTQCRPDIVYEATKLEGEKVVEEFASRLSTVVLRPAWVYGPRCNRTLKLFRSISRRRFFMVGDGTNLRHPVYIRDMLDGFELAATASGIEGETFILASDSPVELRQLVREIIDVLGLDYRPLTIPMPIMSAGCVAVERLFTALGREPPFSSRSLKFFTETSAFDIAKARKSMGFNPKVTLRQGLAATHDHLRRQAAL